MSVLQAEERSNKVADIQSYWIANFINCKAKADVIYQLASHPDVATISYNNVMEVVSDSKDVNSRGTQAVTPTIGQHLTQIKADKVWDLGYTGKGVVVAIIDSGVNTEHTDLKDHLWNGNAQHGYNIVNPGQNPIDDRSHGTHCAGIICGDGTSGTMTGVAPDAQLMCIKGYDSNTGFTIDRLITCVQWAVDNDAHIINISQGWLGVSDANRRTLRTVFDNVLGSGVIAVVACGNDRDKIDNYPVPGNVRTPGDCPPPWLHPDQTTTGGLSSVVSVGGVDDSNNVVAISSQGPAKWDDYPYNPGMGLIRPDIVAPATIYSLSNDASNNKYVTKGGTSQAAPCVTGVMALMLEKNPELTPEDLCRIVERTATRRTATKDNLYGSGVVDAFEAVNAVTFNVNEPVIKPYDFTRTFNAGENLSLELTLINNGKTSTNGNTTVTISESDTYTTIVDGSETYGTMGVMDLNAAHSSEFIDEVTASATFKVSFSKEIPDNHEVTFTVTAGSSTFDIVVTVYNELVAPSLTATANGTDINLSWNATNNATSYNIYRDGAFLENTTSTSYTDDGLEYGTVYAYTVTTKRGELESEHSLVARAQTTDNPAKPSPTNVIANNNVVTWTNGENSNGSNIYRKDYVAGTEVNIATNVNGTSYTDDNWNSLEDGIYQYGVANLYAEKENIYEEDFSNIYVTASADIYSLMNAYWYIYMERTGAGSNNYKWSLSSSTTNSGETFAGFSGNAAFIVSNYEYNVNDQFLSYLVTRPMTYNEPVKLSFKYITPTWTDHGTNILKVMVSTTSYNSGWTELWSSNGADVQNWTEQVVDLSAYVGQQFYIAFVNIAGSGYCTGVDNVSIFVEDSSESRIEWSNNVGNNVNMFVQDGNWSNTDNWTAKRLPNETEKVIIDANATITSGNITVNTLVINEGNTLTLNDGVILTVNGDFANTDVDAFIINDGAQVLQNNDDVSATFVMNINNPIDWIDSTKAKTGWQFIASPVKYSKISDFVPSSSDYDLYKYDGTKDLEWLNHKDETTYDAPAVPQNLVAVATSTSTITLSWNAVEGASGYNVYYDGDNYIDTKGNTYDFAGLEAGTEYCYTVTAVNAYGESEKPTAVCTKTITLAPQNLVAEATGPYSIDLTWDAVEGAERYMVYKNSELIASFVTRTDYTFENLNPATEYCFTVKSVNYLSALIGTESEASAPACATTDLAIPTAPQNVVAEATSPYSIKLTWNAVAGAATYKIYLADAVVASDITETEYTIEGLAPQNTYYYTVTAINVKGESPKSTAAGATTPMAMPDVPQNLVATSTGSSIELSWSASTGAASYKVYDNEGLVAQDITGTSYTVYDLAAGEYCFTVTAVNAAGETNASNEACATVTEQEQGPIAEHVVIGEGTSSTTVLPSTFSSAYSISQQIYTRADIGQTGSIKSVSFKYKSGSATTRTVKVYMKHSVQGLFTDSNSWESMTVADLVYDGNITISGTPDEWIRIKLSEPFEYTGGNLVVCVYDYTNRADNSTSFYADELSETKSLYYYPLWSANPLNPANMNGNGYTTKNRNQIRFSFVTGNEPAIPAAPTNLIATCSQETPDIDVYANAITLTWDADATAETYHIYDEGGNKIGQTGGTSFTIEGLECATRYCYYVSAENETGEGAKAEVCTTTITEVPQNVVARSTDETTINMSWDPVETATSYKVYLSDLLVGTSTTTSCDITGLVTGNYYCYSVVAVNEGGESSKSVLACAEAGDVELEMCNVIFTLKDSWGDGWNGNKLTVSGFDNSFTIDNTHCDNGDKHSYTFTLEIPKGTEVTVTFTKGTNYPAPEETSFTITCENGIVLASAAQGSLSGGEVFTFVADCTPKAPNAPVLAANATSLKTIALSWNAVANATSYNVYQGAAKIVTGLTTTSYNVGNLNASTNYCFSVTAVNEIGESELSEAACARTMDAPTAPQNLVATATGSSSISLTWNETANAISYNVYQDSEFIKNVTATTYVVKNLNPETEYCFTVTSVNGDFESAATEAVCATTEKGKVLMDIVVETGTDKNPDYSGNFYLPVYDYSAYSMSQQIYTAEELGGSIGNIFSVAFKLANYQRPVTIRQYEIYLTQTNLDTFNGYNFVAVSENDKVFDGEVSIPSVINEWFTINFDVPFEYTGGNLILTVYDKTGSGCSYHMFYKYSTTGRSLYKQGSSEYDMSSLGTGISLDYVSQIQLGMSVDPTPTAPQNLVATAESSSSITLTWNAVGVATSYNVYNGAELVANVTGTTCTVQGLNPSTTYCYKVTSVNELGESEASAEACATTKMLPPSAPTNLTATTNGENSIALTWNASATATSYNVYQGANIVATGVTGTSYTVEGLDAGTEYCFTVKAVNNGGESVASTEACAETDAFTGCYVTFTLKDKYGDGWNGNSLTVSYGTITKSLTVSSNKSLYEEILAIPQGANLTITYVKSQYSSWPEENSFSIAYESGEVITAAAEGSLSVTTTFGPFNIDCTPAVPGKPELSAASTGETTIELKMSASGAETYNIYQGGAPIATGVTGDTYIVNGLSGNSQYCFTVVAVNEVGESEMSDEACATTFAAGITIVAVGEGNIAQMSAPVYNAGNGAVYSLSQQIYTQSEIGVTSGSVKGISFHHATGNNNVRDIVVYMQNVDKALFSGNYDWNTLSDSDIVYQGTFNFGMAEDWVTIYFQNEFEYTGGNIAVTVYDKTGSGYGYTYDICDKFYCSQINEWRGMYYTKTSAMDLSQITSIYGTKMNTGNWGSPANVNYINNIKLTIGPSSAKSSVASEKMTDLKAGFEKANSVTSSGVELSKFDVEFEQGVGYLASYENETVAEFKGTLNHEKSYTFNLDYNDGKDLANFHLLGNPFSFNMNWDNTTANGLVNGYAVVNEDGGYEYFTSGEIKVGDGFFVKAKDANPTLTYNSRGNRDREEVSSLNVVASGKAGNDNVVVNLAGEQEGFPKIQNFNEDIALIYVLDDKRPYGIYNCNSDALEVELVFKAKRMGEYNIHIEPNGKFDHVILLDKINDVETDMLSRSYSFTTTPQENGNRFVLKFAKGEGSVEQDKFAFLSGDELIIEAEGVVQIIDVMGRVVYSNEVTSDNNRIDTSKFNTAAYIIRLINGNGVKSQKIVVY